MIGLYFLGYVLGFFILDFGIIWYCSRFGDIVDQEVWVKEPEARMAYAVLWPLGLSLFLVYFLAEILVRFLGKVFKTLYPFLKNLERKFHG